MIERVITKSPHVDAHGNSMFFERTRDGKLKRISKAAYLRCKVMGLASDVSWEEATR